jgi:hypothetical protein
MGGGDRTGQDPNNRRDPAVLGLSDRLRSTAVHNMEPDLAELVVEQLAAQRTRRRWIGQRDVEAASLVGTLLDLAENEAAVSIRTTTGRTFTGVIRSIGDDHISVVSHGHQRTLVALRSVVGVHVTDRQNGPATGDRVVAGEGLPEALAWLAAHRARISVGTTGTADLVTGTLWSCGTDVCTLRDDATDGRWAHIPIGQIAEVTVLER